MRQDLSFYGKLVLRRSPSMILLFILSTGIATVFAMRAPDTYESRATLLVEAAQIPDEMLRASIQLKTERQLEIIQQRLLTRANLIDVARSKEVFPNQSQMNPDDVVAQMRQRTRIRQVSGRNRVTQMLVAFEGPNPRQTAAVVNEYVTLILAENSDLRSARAEGALDFFEQEVEGLSEQLVTLRQKVATFKNENADALPDNLNLRMGRQSLLQERISRIERDIGTLQSRRESVQRIYENPAAQSLANNAGVRETPEMARLRKLEGEMRVALSVYSEQNPRVRLLRQQIDALKLQLAAAAPDPSAQDDDDTANTSTGIAALDAALSDIDSQLESLAPELEEAKAEMVRLQDTIDRTPGNGIALEALLRDQNNLQTLYTAAVQRLSQAQMGERIELSSRGERIVVLEPASVPSRPSSPNRPMIIGAGAGIGLGLAFALFFLLEVFNTSIRRPADIRNALGIVPLATLPQLETVADRRLRRTFQVSGLIAVLVAVPTFLWAVDTYYQPLDLLATRAINLIR